MLRSVLRPEAVEDIVKAGHSTGKEGSQPDLSAVEGAVREQLGGGCATTKFLLRLHDGHAVEAVLIPQVPRNSKRKTSTTLCVSSQVGCAQGCRFCATASMGIVRDLGADEILAQVVQGRRLARVFELPRLTNVVFMGMGEPAANPSAVLAAAEALTDSQRMAVGRRKLIVSTVAPSPYHVSALAGLRGQLAWSLHTANDELRRSLVPSVRHSVAELRDAFLATLRAGDAHRLDRRLLVALVLIDGVNDSTGHAREAAELLRPLYEDGAVHLTINLIPYNDAGRPGFHRPPAEAVIRYRDAMFELLPSVMITLRHARGEDAAAACGQLATERAASFAKPAAGAPAGGSTTASRAARNEMASTAC